MIEAEDVNVHTKLKYACPDSEILDSDDEGSSEFWSKLDFDSLCAARTGSKSATSVPLEDKRARHKLVERRRRDKTRAYVEQLQSLLPNIGHSRPNPNVNFVLEKTLQHLQALKLDQDACKADDVSSNEPDTQESMALELVQVVTLATQRPPIDDITTRKYIFSFDNAPFGIVISQINGVFIKANEFFRTMFLQQQKAPLMVTMFSLTASQDLATTMKVGPKNYSRPRSAASSRTLVA